MILMKKEYNDKLKTIMKAENLIEILNGKKAVTSEEVKNRVICIKCLEEYMKKNIGINKETAIEELLSLWIERWNTLAVEMGTLINNIENTTKKQMTSKEVLEGFKE